MMDAGFVNAMVDRTNTPEEVNGRTFIPAGWTESIEKLYEPSPLAFHTLSAIADVSKSLADPHRIVVLDYDQVEIQGDLEDEAHRFRRKVFAKATALKHAFRFDQHLGIEDMLVGLQTCFVETVTTQALCATLSSIRQANVRETADSGYAQEVTVTRGVVVKEWAKVPNPIELRPFRTFREIEQPESDFVFRVQPRGETESPRVVLYQTMDMEWRLSAIERVKGWLEKVATVPVIG